MKSLIPCLFVIPFLILGVPMEMALSQESSKGTFEYHSDDAYEGQVITAGEFFGIPLGRDPSGPNASG